jgi:EAL domain-containing protein (putative c-di-GMP-specific phosphodiesterase class I)
MGTRYAQGYHLGRPEPAEQLAAQLSTNTATVRAGTVNVPDDRV